MDSISDKRSDELEDKFVRSTYNNIASDFSQTRYNKWPRVDTFLKNLPEQSILLDVGCGNGKYLDNSTTLNIGCDISLNLLKICKERKFEVVLCDMSRLPFRRDAFDSVICVASLHHIVSTERRQKCLEGILKLLAPNVGQILVQVWSYEQQLESSNPYLKNKYDESLDKPNQVDISPGVSLPIHKNRTPFTEQDVLVPFHTKSSPKTQTLATSTETQLRYYHVFKQKELDSMFDAVPSVKIEDSYYDKGNWCVIARRLGI